jgi:hypothetical protein
MPPEREVGGMGMFDRLKKTVADKVADVRVTASAPPDPAAVPDVAGTDLAAVDRGVLGAYLGREVTEVGPLGPGGAEATSFLGQRLQAGLREQGGAAGAEPRPGELYPGQIEATLARLRAEGMPDEQLRMVEARIGAAAAEHLGEGWSVTFAGDERASVQLFEVGSESAAEFDRLRARHGRESGTDGSRPEDTPLLTATVQWIRGTPYETYSLSGRLAAAGPTHVAIAASPRINTRTLAGLAALALRTTEPRTGTGLG